MKYLCLLLLAFTSQLAFAQNTYDNYSTQHPTSTFVTKQVAQSGGLDIDITNDILTVDFEFVPNPGNLPLTVKTGNIVAISSNPALPDLLLGIFDGRQVSVVSGYLVIQTLGTPPSIYSIDETFTFDLAEIDNVISLSPGQNYVAGSTIILEGTTDYTTAVALNTPDRITNVQYFDGLGRPLQSSAVNASPDKDDIVTPFTYDALGRADKSYLPYADKLNGQYSSTSVADQLSYYASPDYAVVSTTKPFAQTIFEKTPLSRVKKQGAPGVDWQPTINPNDTNDKSSKTTYRSNVGDNVINWDWNETNGFPENLGYFADNKLYATETLDAENNKVVTFTSNTNETILKRVYEGTNVLETYYIYDDRGNLVMVMPPLATDRLANLTNPSSGVSYAPINTTVNYTSFVTNPGSGGGGIDIDLVGSQLTVVFDAGFSPSTLVTGNITSLNTQAIPNMTLGTVGKTRYTVKIENNYLKLEATPGGTVSQTQQTFSVNLDEINMEYLPEDITISQFDGKSYVLAPETELTLSPGFEVNAAADGKFSVTHATGTGYAVEVYDGLTFQYEYDFRNRMIGKKVPGADWVHMVYDERDRMVMTQDGNRRAAGEWLFTKYDLQNRPVLTGIVNGGDRASVQNAVDSYYNNLSGSQNWGEELGSVVHGYTNNSYPQVSSSLDYLTATYYDNYDFGIPIGYEFSMPSGFSGIQSDNLKGQSTATKTKVLGSTTFLWNISYYDDRYRVIQTVSGNHLGGREVISNQYNFPGWLEKTKRQHNNSSISYTERFEYDHIGRVVKHFHQIDGQAEVLLVHKKYNEIGELIEKNLHETNSTTYAQSIDYRYNEQGWLLSINQADLGDNGVANDDTTDKFGMKVYYNKSVAGYSNTPLYNGNISAIEWRSSGDGQKKLFTYNYDDLSRLKSANYVRSNGTSWNTDIGAFSVGNITYDRNGNIGTLDRWMKVGSNITKIDSLVYSYESVSANRLNSVKDNKYHDEGFKDGSTSEDDYVYDSSGNMIVDKNKNITNITYNHLNLPTRVDFQDNSWLEYTYSATGMRLKKLKDSGESSDYIGGIHYKDGTLEFLQYQEGRALKAGNTFNYEYNLVDHLGNVRVTVSSSGNVIQRDDYYPFGLTFNTYSQSPENRYLFNQGLGKVTFKTERQNELSLDFTKFRAYDYSIGRFINIDPLADTQPQESWTPYHYSYNSPIVKNDPNGDFAPWLIGAVVGGLVEYGTQVAINRMNGQSWEDAAWNNIDGADVVISTIEGGITAGASVGKNLLVKTTIVATSEVAKATIDANAGDIEEKGLDGVKIEKDVKKIVTDAAIGTAFSVVGSEGAKHLVNASSDVAVKGAKSSVTAANKNLNKSVKAVLNKDLRSTPLLPKQATDKLIAAQKKLGLTQGLNKTVGYSKLTKESAKATVDYLMSLTGSSATDVKDTAVED